MQVTTVLISPQGAWFAGSGPALNEAIGYPDPDFDVAAFAVRNLGYIKVETIENILLDIEFHPLHVAPAALAAAQDHLAASLQRLVRLRYLAQEWRTEIAVSADQAARRLSELCVPFQAIANDVPYKATRLGDRALFSQAEDSARRALFQKWRASFHQFDDTILPFAIRRGLAGSMTVVGVLPGADEPVFRYIGEQFWGFGSDFFLRAIGEKVQHQPDKLFGEWVAQFYREVAASRHPRFDRVDARIDNSARGIEYRYDRLMLPWSTPSGEVLITVCSRFLPDDAPADNVPSKKPSRSS
jgi:hypothetical protein